MARSQERIKQRIRPSDKFFVCKPGNIHVLRDKDWDDSKCSWMTFGEAVTRGLADPEGNKKDPDIVALPEYYIRERVESDIRRAKKLLTIAESSSADDIFREQKINDYKKDLVRAEKRKAKIFKNFR